MNHQLQCNILQITAIGSSLSCSSINAESPSCKEKRQFSSGFKVCTIRQALFVTLFALIFYCKDSSVSCFLRKQIEIFLCLFVSMCILPSRRPYERFHSAQHLPVVELYLSLTQSFFVMHRCNTVW